jgi:hypothetical protein
MRKYWTCGKFANWLRGVESPGAATSEEWDVWTRFAKTMHPFRYWLADTGLRTLEDIWCWLPNRINDVRYYLNNRYTTKTHALTSNLPRGQWHEFETRLLHSAFDTFVDFIEIETAWNHCMWDDAARKKYRMPWWRGQWWTRWFCEWRRAEAGVAHLEWEMTLKNVEWVDESDPEYGKPTHQAVAAKEKWALYYWWKYVRPHRADPYDYTGWSAYCEELRQDHGENWLFNKHKKDPERSRELLDRINKLEEQYNSEDEEMLIRLVKLRKSLWT